MKHITGLFLVLLTAITIFMISISLNYPHIEIHMGNAYAGLDILITNN